MSRSMKESMSPQLAEAEAIFTLSLEGLGDNEVDPGGGPEEHILRQETVDLLLRAVGRLSEKERRMLGLFYEDGMSQRDISRVMALSPARISQIHQRALRRLRGHFGRDQRQALATRRSG